MKYETKRKIAAAYRAIILIPVGGLITVLGFMKSDEEGYLLGIIGGLACLLIGLYYAYDLFVGITTHYNKKPSYAKEKEAEAERLRKLREEKEAAGKAKAANAIGNDAIPEDSMRTLKDLYDSGVLSEEEFTEKKKQLLNL